MPIQVTCPKCHKRFNVSEKFAGKTGPCPSCKATIRVPAESESVVIHAPEHFGPKDAEGRAVLKPIERTEVRTSPAAVVGIVGGVMVAIIVALVLRATYAVNEAGYKDVPLALLAAGALLLAPPAAWAGYWFLRDDELEPHRGAALALRVGICGLLYAGLWAAYGLVKHYYFGGNQPEMFHFLFIGPALLGAGGAVALATLDLEFGNGAIHYAFYLLITVLFCFLLGVPAY
jgi:hypothetical protein